MIKTLSKSKSTFVEEKGTNAESKDKSKPNLKCNRQFFFIIIHIMSLLN